MFTFSKMNPEIVLDVDSHKNLGEQILKSGNRTLLICSGLNSDRSSLSRLKDQLALINITFIQYNQLKENLNRDNLNQIIQRAKDFNVSSIISLGEFNQIMAGRYIAEILDLPYYELPTLFHTPFLLFPYSIYSNRVGDSIEIKNIDNRRVSQILVDISLKRELDPLDYTLTSLSILMDLAQLFISQKNHTVSSCESENLFFRVLDSIEKKSGSDSELYRYGLTTSLYHEISTETELNLTLFSWIAGYRFKTNPQIFVAKLLPWFLEMNDREDISSRIRNILLEYNLDGRLTDLGFTLEQLISTAGDNEETISVIKKAF